MGCPLLCSRLTPSSKGHPHGNLWQRPTDEQADCHRRCKHRPNPRISLLCTRLLSSIRTCVRADFLRSGGMTWNPDAVRADFISGATEARPLPFGGASIKLGSLLRWAMSPACQQEDGEGAGDSTSRRVRPTDRKVAIVTGASPPSASAAGTHQRRSTPTLAPVDDRVCNSLCSRLTLPCLLP